MVKKGEEAASTMASAPPPAPESDSSMGSQKRDPFSHLLKFPEEMEPVYEELYEEQQERRQLDQVRITKNIMYLDRINDELDVNVKERIESDVLIDKLAISRLDAMQRPRPRPARTRCAFLPGGEHAPASLGMEFAARARLVCHTGFEQRLQSPVICS